MIILVGSLVVLSIFCALLAWFCYKLVFRLNFVSENMVELYTRLDEFDQHVNFIYELEMYYGDETLKNLIRHSRDLRNFMKKYKEIMDLLEDQQIIEEEFDDESKEAEDNNEESKEKFASSTGKTVFYSGT